jgi:hypothetical protein
MPRQVAQRQDRRQQVSAVPSRPMLAKGPERPGIPAGRPDVRVVTLERVGQEIRRGLIDARRDGRRPSPRSHRADQDIGPQPAPEQMPDSQPAEGRRRPEPPGDPDGGIGHPGLGIAGQRPPAEPARIPRRPVAELRDPPGDRLVMRQEQEDEVVADGPRVAPVGVVDAGPPAVDDQAGRIGGQPREAGRGQGQECGRRQPRPGDATAPGRHDLHLVRCPLSVVRCSLTRITPGCAPPKAPPRTTDHGPRTKGGRASRPVRASTGR